MEPAVEPHARFVLADLVEAALSGSAAATAARPSPFFRMKRVIAQPKQAR